MNISKDKLNKAGRSKLKASVCAWLVVIGSASFMAVLWQNPAAAQNAPIQPPNSLLNWQQPGAAVPQGAAPPPGDGPTAKNEITGDTVNQPPPTGTATTGTGNNFPTIQNQNRPTVYVYAQTYEPVYPGPSNGGGQASDISTQGTYRGLRMVMTIRGDNLTATQLTKLQGILTGVNLQGPPMVQQFTATNDQIEQINEALYPDASQQGWGIATLQGDGRLKIMQDPSAAQWAQIRRPLDTNLYNYQPTLPIVPVFCRFLVILGVVTATVLVSKAAYSMCFGHAYAGTRAIAAMTGLATLLCAFTIYKIVILNILNSNSTTVQANVKNAANAGNPTSLPNLPIVPAAPGGRPARAGIPVIPDSQN
jgi:hypothetical protein